MTADMSTEKTKLRRCPTCNGPLHRDPVTKRFTRHPDGEPVPAPEPEPLPKRKPGLLRRFRG